MSTQPEPRIGDAERAAAADALADHYAAGRLTHEEFDERVAQVWTAKTNSHLSPLFIDLPAPGGPAVHADARSARPAGGSSTRGPWLVGQDATRRSRGGEFRFPWLPIVVLVVGLSFLLPGPWWLFLLAAFLFSRSFRHAGGCAPHSRRRTSR